MFSFVLYKLVSIYNGRRKVARLADEVKELAKHGVMIKPELQGLLPDQIKVGYPRGTWNWS